MNFINFDEPPKIKEVVNVVDYIHGLNIYEELKKDFK